MKSPEWFQVVMNLRIVFGTVKNEFIQDRKYNPMLMLYRAEDHHERQWRSDRQNPSSSFISIHAQITNKSQS